MVKCKITSRSSTLTNTRVKEPGCKILGCRLVDCSQTSSSRILQYLFNTWLLFCCAHQRTPSTARGSLMWTWHSSSNCERGSASLRRSFSTMLMSTCPQHTFASVTSKDVSWTGTAFIDPEKRSLINVYICILHLFTPPCSSNRQHLIHGGERGPAGPDGAD